jgi:hypothetical protein
MVEARGEGTETEPKLGTHCWPGKNNILTRILHQSEDPYLHGEPDPLYLQDHQEHRNTGQGLFASGGLIQKVYDHAIDYGK